MSSIQAVRRQIPKKPSFAQVLRGRAVCRRTAAHTAKGPNEVSKAGINHLEKPFVTIDVVTILRGLEVWRSAVGNYYKGLSQTRVGEPVYSGICWSLLELAEKLLKIGLTFSGVIEGF